MALHLWKLGNMPDFCQMNGVYSVHHGEKLVNILYALSPGSVWINLFIKLSQTFS